MYDTVDTHGPGHGARKTHLPASSSSFLFPHGSFSLSREVYQKQPGVLAEFQRGLVHSNVMSSMW